MSGVIAVRGVERDAIQPRETFIRLAGWAGVLCFGLYIVAFPVYLPAGAPPPFADAPQFARYVHDHSALVIAASVVFALDFTLLVVWFLGVRQERREHLYHGHA